MSEHVGLSAYESEEVRTRITELIQSEISPHNDPHSMVLALWKMLVVKATISGLLVARPPLVDAFRRGLAAVEDWKRLWRGRPLPTAPLGATTEEEEQAAECVAEDVLGVDFYLFWLEVFQRFDPCLELTKQLERDAQRFTAQAESSYAKLVKDNEPAEPVSV